MIQETNCRPCPILPPSPNRVSRRSAGNTLFLPSRAPLPSALQLSCIRGLRLLEGLFPGSGDVDRKGVLASGIEPMLRSHPTLDRRYVCRSSPCWRSARLEEGFCTAECLSENACRVHARLENLFSVARMIAAVDGFACQINHRVVPSSSSCHGPSVRASQATNRRATEFGLESALR